MDGIVGREVFCVGGGGCRVNERSYRLNGWGCHVDGVSYHGDRGQEGVVV